jgi:hypothetical protein
MWDHLLSVGYVERFPANAWALLDCALAAGLLKVLRASGRHMRRHFREFKLVFDVLSEVIGKRFHDVAPYWMRSNHAADTGYPSKYLTGFNGVP